MVESFEIKSTMLLFIPEAGEFVVPRATCKLLLIVIYIYIYIYIYM